MSVRNLSCLMHPSSVVLIGASEKPGSVGAVITRNLLGSGFNRPVYLVNRNYSFIGGVKCYPGVAALPEAPDLAVVAVPRDSVPGVIAELGDRGTRGAVVITAGFGEGGDEDGRRLCSRMVDAARPHLLRIVGPNCLGIMAPASHLNASMAHIVRPPAGSIALVAQSGAVQTSVLDWAVARGIGFSCFISLGDMADVDFGDMLDYLASDFQTRAILLYMETVTQCRKFMSAARAAARVKPVIVVKAGRSREGALAAARHTGAVEGDDAVYDAAFRRAGMLRVLEMQALFDAVETLAMMPRRITGDRMAILTNGGGVGVMATDALMDRDGRMADLSPETLRRLDGLLPPTWSRGNPVDIMSDASAERYAEALEVLLQDRQVDAVLVLSCPVAVMSGAEAASAVTRAYQQRLGKPRPPVLLTSWLGEHTAAGARRIFAEQRIPSYKTPFDAVRAFMHMVRYQSNQEMLMETPASIPESFSPDVGSALDIVGEALAGGAEWLSEDQTRSILAAYGIGTTWTSTGDADPGPPGPADLLPPSGLPDPPVSCPAPGHELLIHVVEDAHFGPIIRFGHGGPHAPEIRDRAVALPPLNLHLAREVMSRTRICGLIRRESDTAPAVLKEVALTLVKVSQMVCDIAEIAELEINPLRVEGSSIRVQGARMRVARSPMAASERLAIRPYPKELEDWVTLRDGQVLQLRPIRPEDEPGFLAIVESLTPEARRMRFLHPVEEMSHQEAARLTQIDYDREMALVAASGNRAPGGAQELHGSVRIICDPDSEHAEYAILVHSKAAGKGLGKILMRRIIDYARSRGIREIQGQVLYENAAMLKVCNALGFTSRRDMDDPGVVVVSLKL
jgi:acetyltransferase